MRLLVLKEKHHRYIRIPDGDEFEMLVKLCRAVIKERLYSGDWYYEAGDAAKARVAMTGSDARVMAFMSRRDSYEYEGYDVKEVEELKEDGTIGYQE